MINHSIEICDDNYDDSSYHDYLSGKSLNDLSLILSDTEFQQLKQMIHNNEYWDDRLANATHQALNQGMTQSEQMFRLYDDLANKLSNELLQLYSKIDAQKALGDVHISDFYRSGQLQNILDTIRKECQKMGQYENKTMNKLLTDAVNKGYEIAGDTFDIHLGHLNKKAVESVVRDKWTEKSFSDRIWDNKAKLIDQLNDKLLTGLSTGQSPYKIATELSKSLNVGKNVAQRLAITEYMNKLNMGQKKAYEEAGYDEVRWHAVEDERKCAVCGKLHDTKFKLNEAPHAPIHPRCRCILLPVIDEVEGTESHWMESEKSDLLRAMKHANKEKEFSNSEAKSIARALYNNYPEEYARVFSDILNEWTLLKAPKGKSKAGGGKIKISKESINGVKSINYLYRKKPFITMFHEFGHAFDEVMGFPLDAYKKNFSEMLTNDLLTYLGNDDIERSLDNLFSHLERKNIATNFLQDILSSMELIKENGDILNYKNIKLGHDLHFYWNKYEVARNREFFAHYFSTIPFEKEHKLLQELFPTLSQLCDKMIVEYLRRNENG